MKKKWMAVLLSTVLAVAPAGTLLAEELGDGSYETAEPALEEEAAPAVSQEEESLGAEVFFEEEETKNHAEEDAREEENALTQEDELSSGEEKSDADLLRELLQDGEEDLHSMVPMVGAKSTAAASGTCGNSLNWSFANGVLTITGTGAMYDYELEEGEIDENGRWVTTSTSPFANLDIKTLQVGSGVTHIGTGAFFDGSSLTSVTLPSTLTSIGNGAFMYCTSLESIPLPSSVRSLGEYAFSNCRKLSAISLPSGMREIQYALFEECTRLSQVTVPSTVSSIGDWAFVGCSSLKSISLPVSVVSIGQYAFADCGLTSVNVPSRVTVLEEGVFSGCDSLSSVTLPSGLTYVGEWSFSECRALKSIALPNTVSEIADYAFYGCSGILTITLPSGLTALRSQVFLDCTNLKALYFTGNAPAIDANAFAEVSLVDGSTSAALTATAYFPCNNATWTASVLKNYGGEIQWEKNHQWDAGVIIKPASGDTPAQKSYTCRLCGEKKTEVPPVPMYRLYNPYTGEHLYTASVVERQDLVVRGWNYEGIAWYAPGNDEGQIIWRLFNPAEDQHLYTMDEYEVLILTTQRGWEMEGPAWRSYVGMDVPIYRLFNNRIVATASHHVTSDLHERDTLVAGSDGWVYEGIAWYGINVSQ